MPSRLKRWWEERRPTTSLHAPQEREAAVSPWAAEEDRRSRSDCGPWKRDPWWRHRQSRLRLTEFTFSRAARPGTRVAGSELFSNARSRACESIHSPRKCQYSSPASTSSARSSSLSFPSQNSARPFRAGIRRRATKPETVKRIGMVFSLGCEAPKRISSVAVSSG